jgi:hypothetical protein
MSHNLNYHTQDNFLATTSRQEKGYVQSDGATANRRIEWTLGAAGNVAGSDLSEVGHVFRVPTGNLPVSPRILFIGPNTTFPGNNSLAVTIGATGALAITAEGSVAGTNRRSLTWAQFRPTYSGQVIRMDIVFTSGTNNPVIYINGVDVSANFLLTTAGVVPDWMSSSLVPTYRVVGIDWPSSDFTPGFPINRALSASEIQQMIDSGEESASDGLGGTMTALGDPTLSSDSSVFWSDPSNVFTVGGGQIIGSAIPQFSALFGNNTSNRFMRAGQRIRYSITVSAVSGQFAIQQGANINPTIVTFSSPGTYSGTYTAVTIDNSAFAFALKLLSVGPGSITVTALSLIYEGSLIQPVFQPGPVIADSGPNGISGVMIGMNQVTHNSIWGEVSGQATWAGTHEAKRIFATSTPYLPQNAVITSITTKATAASSGSGLTIGTTNSNNRYVTLNTYTTAAKSHALSNRTPAGTATNDLDIVIDPDTANYTGTISVTIKYYVSSNL